MDPTKNKKRKLDSSKKRKRDSGPKSNQSPKAIKVECEPPCKLVKLSVILNATQTNVTGAKNWACVKKATDEVIVEATTNPDNEACWNKINWSGDSGTDVPGHPNQRKLSRAAAKHYHVEAELCGDRDHVDVWVLWATVTIQTTGTTPPNAVQFGARYDGTENLGARVYNGNTAAVGKVVPYAVITPVGVHDIVKAGWESKRERMSHDWADGVKVGSGNAPSDYWNTAWVDDTSSASFKRLTPDNADKIYDRDAPNVAAAAHIDYETYNNFRQWIEWRGETCSDKAGWYWQGRWKKSATPQVTLKDVGTGNIALPNQSHFHP